MFTMPLNLDAAQEIASESGQDEDWLAAGRRNLRSTLQALLREGLLPAQRLSWRGGTCWLPLSDGLQSAALRFKGLHIGRIGDCRLDGQVWYYAAGREPREILTGAALLACVARSLAGNVSPAALRRVLRELDNSVDNEAESLRHRRQWGRQLRQRYCADGAPFLAGLRRASEPNPSLLLEQWGTVGHPWHPMSKTKLGLMPEEVRALSPEFGARLQLPLAALRRDCARIEALPGCGDYAAWFARQFPQASQQWRDALRAAGQGVHLDDWLPLPLHPYQAQHLVPREFAAEIAAGEVLLLEQAAMPAMPTMSFRTVVPDGSPHAPHVKLPVSLRLTSVQRAVSPKIATMGPRFTALLRQVLEREAGFDGRLDIIPEVLGMVYDGAGASDERSRHLSVLMRGNPMAFAQNGLFPLPVGALFAPSPVDGRPLALELARLGEGDGPQAAQAYFRRHAATVLSAALGAYLLYGMGFEAHQQNSFMLLDRDWRPARLLLRDFGDLRVHMPTLRHAGLDLVPYSAGHACFDTDEPVRDKLLHAMMLCHLCELGLALAHAAGEEEDGFYRILREETENVFERLRARVPAARWEAERAALLEGDWPAKSFLRMRLLGTSDDVHGRMRNPLRA
ncbi:IucA/IucC family protein [Noviherbaspirillum pedocola]|uniref:IucA/IucC family siderophore biosynthesis protein n=1 Tax=Noviherbaspirillum pedocola TaxID=2801341 RepID=A0A934W7Q7_9BURK|nr:IucA/IucC family protein [Noviherbaspirillum pedocola]MBK4737727.1 IucA/IucC family siderophore biosynthesis protein [Noviherbaspirillum pedocola]